MEMEDFNDGGSDKSDPFADIDEEEEQNPSDSNRDSLSHGVSTLVRSLVHCIFFSSCLILLRPFLVFIYIVGELDVTKELEDKFKQSEKRNRELFRKLVFADIENSSNCYSMRIDRLNSFVIIITPQFEKKEIHFSQFFFFSI